MAKKGKKASSRRKRKLHQAEFRKAQRGENSEEKSSRLARQIKRESREAFGTIPATRVEKSKKAYSRKSKHKKRDDSMKSVSFKFC